MISAKINVSKILKEHLFKGAKGVYMDITLIETPDSEYGDYMVVQDLGKEARIAGKRGPILGNGKKLAEGKIKRPETVQKPEPTQDDTDVPF